MSWKTELEEEKILLAGDKKSQGNTKFLSCVNLTGEQREKILSACVGISCRNLKCTDEETQKVIYQKVYAIEFNLPEMNELLIAAKEVEVELIGQ
jgi:hypothetical protein